MSRSLPIRFRVLEYMSTVKRACADDAMEALRAEYGQEKQFNKPNFIDHLMALKENGLLEDVGAEFNSKNELCLYYAINEEGRSTLVSYLPKK